MTRTRRRFACLIVLALALAALPAALALAGPGAKASRTAEDGTRCFGLQATVIGTPGDDRLRGTPGDNVVTGLGGEDRIIGGGGHDVICGGSGEDFITTGKGPDKIFAGSGDDRVISRKGPDIVYGGSGDDRLNGGPGVDACRGESGANVERNCEKTAPPLPEEPGGKNSPPGAVGDTAGTDEDTAKAVDVLANDSDVDGDPLTIAAVDSGASKGKVTITGGGSGISYDPSGKFDELAAGQQASDSFGYTISDGKGHTATAMVAVTVTGVDDPPQAVDDTATVNEDAAAAAIDVLINDTDVDAGPAKSIQAVTQPANGTVVLTGGGTGLTYAPNADYCNDPPGTKPDTFGYVLNGGSTATVAVKVTCVDDLPVAVDDTATVDEDSAAAAIPVLANDTDVDGGPKSIQSVTQPSNGTVVITGGGTGLTFQPDPGFCSLTAETFTYTLNGGDTATVSVTVNCIDDPPVAVDDAATFAEDVGASAINVLANDTDTDGGPKSIQSVTQPSNGTVVITGGGTGLTYQPNANYCNEPPGTTPDTFTYTLNGGDTGAVSVKVTCVDDNPTAVNDPATVNEDSAASAINVLGNDTDPDAGPKSIQSVTQPANGTVVITGGGTGLTYQPNANYCNEPPGTTLDTFTYTLAPGGSTGTVSVKVTCVDDNPTAVNDPATVSEDSGASAIAVLANDTDVDGGPKSIQSVTQPANGTVVITGGGTGLTYQPNANYCNEPPGTTLDTFTYTLAPGGSTGTVSVKVTCVDDNPVAVNDTKTVTEDDPATAIDVLANDTDTDAGPKSIQSVTQPANGTVVITGGGTGLTYQPNANYCNEPPGTTPSTFTYTLNGGSTGTVSVKVTCVPDSATAVNDSATVAEDSSATAIDVSANDTDPDSAGKSIEAVTQPANGTVAITGGGTGLTYQPNANYCNEPPGTTPDTFTYAILGGSSATVSVKVTCVNDAPTDLALTPSSVEENKPSGTVVGSFSTTDVDPGDTFTYALVSGSGDADNGSFEITPGGELKTKASFDFEADASYSIRVKTTDSGSASFEKELTVTIVNANDAPTDLALTPASIDENEPAATEVGTLSTTDQDAGDTFTYDLVGGEGSSGNGSFEVSGSKLKTKASFNFEAQSSYSVRVKTTDAGGLSFEKALTVTVIDVNDPPSVAPDSYSGVVGNTTAVKGDVVSEPNVSLAGALPIANDSDEDAGDTISVVEEDDIPTTGGGSVDIDPDGTFTFEPGPGDKNQNDTFTYKVTDGEATTSGTVTVGIDNVLVWYVNAAAASEGDGRSATPYKVLGGINGAGGAGDADGASDYVFLYGSGVYGGGLPLEASQKLVGQPEGLSVPGHAGLVPASGSDNPAVTNAGGNGIVLANGSEVLRVDAENSTGAGVSGTSVTTSTVGPNTTIKGNTGSAVSLSGAAGGNISIGSTIENQTGSVVSVANRSSGTVTLSGNVSSSNGGVSASSNSGATIAYTGTLNLTRSGGGDTFSATGGGAIKATASANQVSSGSGTAVRVTGTTIDSGGVNFQKASSSGAPNGVVLENTGSTAGLTVSGTGAAGSGGTITGSTDAGIKLANTAKVALASLNVTNGGDDGIRGSGVNGLTLTGSSAVTGNGNAVGEGGIEMTELSGSAGQPVTIAGATITGNAETNVRIVNDAASISSMTISGGTIGDNSTVIGNDGILIQNNGSGSTTGTVIKEVLFTMNRGDHIQTATDSSTNTVQNIAIEDNTLRADGNQPGATTLGGGITVGNGGTAQSTVKIDENDIERARDSAIVGAIPLGDPGNPNTSTLNLTITNNDVGTAGEARSGSFGGDGIFVNSHGNATTNTLIANNEVRNFSNAYGIDLVQNDGDGTVNATVRSNVVKEPMGTAIGAIGGMRIVVGSDETDNGTSCMDIGGAGGFANDLAGSANAAALGNDIQLSVNGDNNTLKLPGYGGGATDDNAVRTYLLGRNTIGAGGILVEHFHPGSQYVNTGSCPTP